MSGPSAAQLRHQLPLLLWLVLVWMLLWGTWSWANVLSGLLVALAVAVLLPLPAVVGGIRVRPLPLVEFLAHFLVDLAISGTQVAWQALRPGRQRRSAVIRVRLRIDSDLLLTIVAQTVSLVPGSLVLDLDREERSIAIHLLHVRDLEHVAREKARVLTTEGRVVRAFGSTAEIAALAYGTEARRGRTTP